MQRKRLRNCCGLIVSLYLSIPLFLQNTAVQAQTDAAKAASAIPSAQVRYFPNGSLDERHALWLTKNLKAVGELPLAAEQNESGTASFRLLQHRLTSQSTLIVVRLDIPRDGEAELFVKRLSQDGQLTEEPARRLTSGQTNALLAIIDKGGFWSLATEEQSVAPRVKDGGTSYVEGLQNGQYHVAYRRTSEPGPIRDIAAYFVSQIAPLKHE